MEKHSSFTALLRSTLARNPRKLNPKPPGMPTKKNCVSDKRRKNKRERRGKEGVRETNQID
jgi:hypothetical protein